MYINTMRIILFLLLQLLESGFSHETCSDIIICSSSETKKPCPTGTFYKTNAKVNGCCPGCVPLKDENQDCWAEDECQSGLICGSRKLCEKDPTQACDYYKRNDVAWNKSRYWDPACLADGSYAPKQCKGEKLAGKCFCFDKSGNRIFGEEEWYKAENMTCECSRLVNEIRKERPLSSMHCNRIGNYEPLQCDLNVCWCASPKTGFPYTNVVPSAMIASLPCYRKSVQGVQYYRKCDSEWQMKRQIKELLTNHGTNRISLDEPACNFDGSYHRVQMSKNKKQCVYLNKEPLTEAVPSETANCNCAYDRHVHQFSRKLFLYDCSGNGDYVERQILDGKIYCIDGDGFIYSEDPEDCSS